MTGRYTRGLRIRTKCVTIEQLVAWFHRFCDESSIFIATQSPRPEGLETAFSIDLADDQPALAGEGVVSATWTTRDNRFKAPGMQIEVRSLTRPSQRVFEQMLIARAVTQDASAKPKQEWGEDSTEVGAPTFDQLAATGTAEPVATAAPAKPKPVAKHTLIGLPAIPFKTIPAKGPITIAVGPTPTPAPAPRAAQAKLPGGISFAVPAKIAPVGAPAAAKRGPVVITPLRSVTTGSNSVVPAATTTAPLPRTSSTPVRPTTASLAMRGAAPAGPVVITPLRSITPIATPAMTTTPASTVPTTMPLPTGSIAPAMPAPAASPAATTPLARGSSAPMMAAQIESAAPSVDNAAPAPMPAIGASASPAIDTAAPQPVPEQLSTRIPRAATTLGSGPVPRMPAVSYDADLPDDLDDAELAREPTNVDAQPMGLIASDQVSAGSIAPDVRAIMPSSTESVGEGVTPPPSTEAVDDGVTLPTDVSKPRAKSEPTWDELAASSAAHSMADVVAESPAVATAVPSIQLAPPISERVASTMRSLAAADAENALPLPPAPDDLTPSKGHRRPASNVDEVTAGRRRRRMGIAIAAVTCVAAAAATAALLLFGVWSFGDDASSSAAPAPSVVAMSPVAAPPEPAPIAEVVPPVVAPEPPTPTEAPTETPIAETPAVADPAVAIAEPVVDTAEPARVEPVAEEQPVVKRVRPAKTAKKPARVKRMGAKPAVKRAKARPKKKKKKACTDLSCL